MDIVVEPVSVAKSAQSAGSASDANSAPPASGNLKRFSVTDVFDVKKDSGTALIHLYRGEMARAIRYRVRLDQTSNWAITIAAGMSVLSLNSDAIPHWFHFAIVIFVTLLMIMEARRFRIFSLAQHRTHLLERGFFGVVLKGRDSVSRDWELELSRSLDHPRCVACLRASC